MASPTEVAERVDECSSLAQAALLESEPKESGNCEGNSHCTSDEVLGLLHSPRKAGAKLTSPSTGPSSSRAQPSLPKPAAVSRTPLSQKIADPVLALRQGSIS